MKVGDGQFNPIVHYGYAHELEKVGPIYNASVPLYQPFTLLLEMNWCAGDNQPWLPSAVRFDGDADVDAGSDPLERRSV